MDLFQTLILTVVEGLTEFLPVSSTGHLVLTAHFLRIPQTEFVKSFEIIIQLGAILSVVFLYRKTLITNVELWKILLLSFLPSAVVGFLFYRLIKDVLIGNPFITVVALILGGIVLILVEKTLTPSAADKRTVSDVSTKQAIVIGFCQAVSVIPGVSRAGATIVGGLLTGLSRKTAVEFSFLLAVPTMIAATALDVFETGLAFQQSELLLLGIGFVGSFVVALLAITYFLRFIENRSFVGFGVYRIVIGIAYWLFVLS